MRKVSTLTESLYKALKKYRNTLEKVGYISIEESKKALLASYIEDLFTPEWALYITEEDQEDGLQERLRDQDHHHREQIKTDEHRDRKR